VLSTRLGWPDCLIAAAALRLDLPLVTLNDKHFKPIRGLRVVRPY
jgi:predicted nucleic acid-binding protein